MSQLTNVTDAQIRELLASEGKLASNDMIQAIREFVTNVGGLANAKKALDSLAEIPKAA